MENETRPSAEKVLVVDDTPENLRLLIRILKEKGYTVRPAATGNWALTGVEADPPDLILLDIRMPNMSGFEVCRRLKADERWRDIPVIFISALSDTFDKVRAFSIGGIDYITKPFQAEEVLARVATHLALRGAQKELLGKNAQLTKEIRERQRAEDALQKAHDELEERVRERTAELADSVAALKHENRQRKRAEKKIRASLNEKEVLLRELCHRTKNNMQVIASMLMLQSAQLKDETVEKVVQTTMDRIQAMALVHGKLHETKNLSHIDLAEYLGDLAALLMRTHHIPEDKIRIRTEMEKIFVLIDTAVPCGLIANELISNSIKHAFPGDARGEIHIRLEDAGQGDILLRVSDNGVGVPTGFDFRKCESFGLQLILGFGEGQLLGKVGFETNEGVACELRFSDTLHKPRV